jgi:hypothetical protein
VSHFNVGRQIKCNIENYIACDIVSLIIKYNQEKFNKMNMDFRVLDIVNEPLPDGDVACIRQVLQHLSNKNIKSVINKLQQYQYIIVTEHLPSDEFIPNIDKLDGGNIRNSINSGIVLTEKPFNLNPLRETVLCCISDNVGFLKTTLYQMF